jgi:hypothetical protein
MKTTSNTQIKQADSRKTTAILKKHLKDQFDINVSIRSESYSGGSSLNVSYTLGKDQNTVEEFLKQLQYGCYHAEEDYWGSKDASLVIDGYSLNTYKHVFVRQDWSKDFNYSLAKMFSDQIHFSGIPKLESEEDLHKNFPERWTSAWTWNDMLFQYFKVSHFVTQDESKIMLKSIHFGEENTYSIYFIYEVDGIEYNTSLYPVVAKKAASPNETVIETVIPVVVTGEVKIIAYSEKAIAVIGDTKTIKDKLKELGGKFNNRLTCGPGWIFSKKSLPELTAAFQKA